MENCDPIVEILIRGCQRELFKRERRSAVYEGMQELHTVDLVFFLSKRKPARLQRLLSRVLI